MIALLGIVIGLVVVGKHSWPQMKSPIELTRVRVEVQYDEKTFETFYDKFAGTSGARRPLKGFSARLDPFVADMGLEYMAHFQMTKDSDYVPEGTMLNSRFDGQLMNVEGFAIRITKFKKHTHDVIYNAHLAGKPGFTPIAMNGEFCGTKGEGRAVEGMTVRVVPKGTTTPLV